MKEKMSEETKTEKQELPKVAEDGSWVWPVGDKKYRLHEATFDELRICNCGQDRLALLNMVAQQEAADGKWEPIVWPKVGAHRLLLALEPGYYALLSVLEVQTRNLSKPSKNTISPTQKAAESLRP